MLIAGVVAVAAFLVEIVISSPGLDAPLQIPLFALVGAVYLAELAVVHLEFGRQAHSFSLSEFALILGVFLADPVDLIVATVVGNLAVLAIHRRQRLTKLVFNVAQFTLQAALAIFVFQTYATFGDPLGPFGWAGAILATLAALLVSDVLINLAMRITGSEVSLHEQLNAFGVTAVAAVLNTLMALAAVVVLWLQPLAAWLALVPPVALFLAYRAYMSQRSQQDRFRMLYEATRDLQNTPRIGHALASAAESLRSMLLADRAEIYLLDEHSEGTVWVTSSGPGNDRIVLERAPVDPDGRERWQAAMISGKALRLDEPTVNGVVTAPLTGTDGGVIGSVLVIDRLGDVAGFSEADLRTLSTFSAQIGAAVSNNRLIKSLAAATALAEERESLIKAKDDFIASVSHELRTPLTSVLGLSHEVVSADGTLDRQERMELLELIAQQSNELSHLVDDLLVSARSDIGTLHMNTEPIDLGREASTVLREMGKTDSIPVIGDVDRALGDGLRVRQIIRNLITNAQRYGGKTIGLELKRCRSQVVLCVVDDGDGVPAAMESTIFEAYGRAHEADSQPASIGLGLHVARRLARRMGGDIIYRRINGRTRFELVLQSVDSFPRAENPEFARALT